MAFEDLDQVFDDTLSLPIAGKTYVFPGADAELGLWCQRLCSAGMTISAGEKPVGPLPQLTFDDEEEDALYVRLCGDAWGDMLTDSVSWEKMKMVAQTVLIWIGSGRELAEAYWNSGGNPEAFAPRRTRRASTRTAGANVTQQPGSMNTTKSHPTNGERSRRRRSRGKSS